ncbi:putative secreted polysaccharide deacetylase [Streptomyces scabiei 87.22]|uniref:Putative secreted polysaccharide deacetylase n=4 Tax=Streptomyces scabiei TaxID=1930 RepID=C9Z6B8_STRSW|nr:MULTISPECIES: polysaccharide deacetylase family protein [Streptomyces]MDW8470388.1 polysaccharide deacetylase family protein [Streptomyces scabiei]MDX2569716.1 polysaccharide deacetylase family protein [Streptomyces scabiei]MDX2626652.1 polysaccharide deacetylase family protein [Streptomyces scabiei]MDX2653341.1 polysaccharide deacetylase family protein [Streptomyces scabiei]MDX2724034.1 polysaccharide deacetylase family protein [Streptomyces scabiei]
MRPRTLLPALLLLGSLTAACAHGTSDPPATASDAARPGSSPAPARTVDPSKIKGLRIVGDSSENSSCPFATSYPDVPGAEAMTAAMKKDVEQRLAGFRSGACESDADGAESRDLNISHQFLVASGDVLGVRLTTQDHSSVGDGRSDTVYWYDGRAGAYRTPLALVAEGSRDAFTTALQDRLEGREGVNAGTLDDTFSDAASRAAVLNDMDFTADGGLRVTFDRGEVGVPAAGRLSVVLPSKTVTPWLSGFGERAQRQTMRPGRSLDLGASHEPAPAVPTHTASGDDDTDCRKVKCIALTFDDGPAAPETANLLTHLARYRARVTFFTVGQNVAAHPDLVRAEARAGHEIGNHSWNHPDLTRLSPRQVASQLHRTSAAIKAATGRAPTLVRPPYGAINHTVKSVTTLSPVLWDVDTEDWKYRDPARVARTVIDKAQPNDVVLLHDIHPTSVAAVPEILRTLSARGYHFVTVSHLRATL